WRGRTHRPPCPARRRAAPPARPCTRRQGGSPRRARGGATPGYGLQVRSSPFRPSLGFWWLASPEAACEVGHVEKAEAVLAAPDRRRERERRQLRQRLEHGAAAGRRG